MSHCLDLQRRKLRPERGWNLLREVQSVGEIEFRGRERGPDSGPGPRLGPASWCNPQLHLTLHPLRPQLGLKQGRGAGTWASVWHWRAALSVLYQKERGMEASGLRDGEQGLGRKRSRKVVGTWEVSSHSLTELHS